MRFSLPRWILVLLVSFAFFFWYNQIVARHTWRNLPLGFAFSQMATWLLMRQKDKPNGPSTLFQVMNVHRIERMDAAIFYAR